MIRYAGILSAYGIALADVVHEAQETCSKTYCQGKEAPRDLMGGGGGMCVV